MLQKLFFDLQYRFGKPPWDSGVTPPEVVAFIENQKPSGHALDLGCGTGTNSIYLAQHGFTVVGVDFSPKAIAAARVKSQRANRAVDFRVADVTRLEFLSAPFDFILDIGCMHAIGAEGRARYADHLARLTRAGSVFMLYAFSPHPASERGHWIKLNNVGITPDEVTELFRPNFALEKIEHGMNRGQRASAWYWFRRKTDV